MNAHLHYESAWHDTHSLFSKLWWHLSVTLYAHITMYAHIHNKARLNTHVQISYWPCMLSEATNKSSNRTPPGSPCIRISACACMWTWPIVVCTCVSSHFDCTHYTHRGVHLRMTVKNVWKVTFLHIYMYGHQRFCVCAGVDTYVSTYTWNKSYVDYRESSWMGGWLLTCILACMSDCLHACLLVWEIAYMHACLYERLLTCMLACMSDCLHACLLVWVIAYVHACLYEWLLTCMLACMSDCLHAWYTYMSPYLNNHAFMSAHMNASECLLVCMCVRGCVLGIHDSISTLNSYAGKFHKFRQAGTQIHTYIHICVHTCIYTHIHAYKYTYEWLLMCMITHICDCLRTKLLTFVLAYVHYRSYSWLLTCMIACLHEWLLTWIIAEDPGYVLVIWTNSFKEVWMETKRPLLYVCTKHVCMYVSYMEKWWQLLWQSEVHAACTYKWSTIAVTKWLILGEALAIMSVCMPASCINYVLRV